LGVGLTTPPWKRLLLRNLKKKTIAGWILQLAEASEEGQGTRRAVEPMMMMMMVNYKNINFSETVG
jgi:hypothetical protein